MSDMQGNKCARESVSSFLDREFAEVREGGRKRTLGTKLEVRCKQQPLNIEHRDVFDLLVEV